MEYIVRENPSFDKNNYEWSQMKETYDFTITTINLDYKKANLLGTIIGNAYFAGDSTVRKYLDEDLKIGVDWEEGFMFEDFYERLTRRFNKLSIGFNSTARRLYVYAPGFNDFKIYETYRIDRLAPIEIFDYLRHDDLDLNPSDSDEDIDKEIYKEFNNLGVEKRTFNYLKRMSFLEDSKIYSKIAWCYLHGFGCDKDFSKAFEYYTKGSELGDSNALTKLGKMHLKGVGTNRDYSEALCLLNQAALLGSIEALNLLVDIYQSKKSGYYNQALALSCMRAGRKLGSEYCKLRLGEAYYYGIGVAEDEEKAKYIWYSMECQEPEGYKEYAIFKYIDQNLDNFWDDEIEFYSKYGYSEFARELYLYYIDKDYELAVRYKKLADERREVEDNEIDG